MADRIAGAAPDRKVRCAVVACPELERPEGGEQPLTAESDNPLAAVAGGGGSFAGLDEISSGTEPVGEKVVRQIVQAVEQNVSVRGGTTEVVVQLDPPELGKVKIHVSTSPEGLSVTIMVGEEQARRAVEGQLEHLQERLTEVLQFLSRDESHGQQRSHNAFDQDQQDDRRWAQSGAPAAAEGKAFTEAVDTAG